MKEQEVPKHPSITINNSMAVGSAHHNRSSTMSQHNKLMEQPQGDTSESLRTNTGQHRRFESTSYPMNLFNTLNSKEEPKAVQSPAIKSKPDYEMTDLHMLRDSLNSLFASTPHFDGQTLHSITCALA